MSQPPENNDPEDRISWRNDGTINGPVQVIQNIFNGVPTVINKI
tara:strand:+ start:1351 stop:1482 length:132 start_codon:yes stop_codon:yes gene_type:complete